MVLPRAARNKRDPLNLKLPQHWAETGDRLEHGCAFGMLLLDGTRTIEGVCPAVERFVVTLRGTYQLAEVRVLIVMQITDCEHEKQTQTNICHIPPTKDLCFHVSRLSWVSHKSYFDRV